MSLTLQSLPPSIPLDLRRELSDPLTPWAISKRLLQSMEERSDALSYRRVEVLPTDPEWRLIWRYFHHDKPTKFGMKRLFCLHESRQMQAFIENLSTLEREAGELPTTWKSEPRSDQRARAIERWRVAASVFSPFQTAQMGGEQKSSRGAKVLPLWHGDTGDRCEEIVKCGFSGYAGVALGDSKNREGHLFGNGIYFTNSARYAAGAHSRGQMLFAWVTMMEPFPVVGDPLQEDTRRLRGRGCYNGYSAHYAPLFQEGSSLEGPLYPCKAYEDPTFDEIVVFQKAQALPRFWVELEVELPYLMSLKEEPLFAGELIPHLMRLLQHPEVERDLKLRPILERELAHLFPLPEAEYLKRRQKILFNHLVKLIDTNRRVEWRVRDAIVRGRPLEALLPAPLTSGRSSLAEREVAKALEPL